MDLIVTLVRGSDVNVEERAKGQEAEAAAPPADAKGHKGREKEKEKDKKGKDKKPGRPPGALPPTQLPGTPLRLSAVEEKLLLQAVVQRVVREDLHERATWELLRHLCWENRRHTQLVLGFIRENLIKGQREIFRPYLKVRRPRVLVSSPSLASPFLTRSRAGTRPSRGNQG